MPSSKPASAGETHQETHKENDEIAPAVGGVKESMLSETSQEINGPVEAPEVNKTPLGSETLQEKPVKPLAEIVGAMFNETKLSKVEDVDTMLRLSGAAHRGEIEREADDPEWYNHILCGTLCTLSALPEQR
ncbi:MAG: hypothetical protein Q9209_002167 [Squamulea sp. 1 TL-2023]